MHRALLCSLECEWLVCYFVDPCGIERGSKQLKTYEKVRESDFRLPSPSVQFSHKHPELAIVLQQA